MHFKLDSFLIDNSLIDYLVIKKEETPNTDVAEERKKNRKYCWTVNRHMIRK